MGRNTLNIPKVPKKQKPSRLASWLNSFSPFRQLVGDKFPVHYIDGALWLLLIGIVLIGWEHNAERQVRQIRKKKEEIDNLRTKYTIMKASFMKRGKQSELIPQVAEMGLVESKQAPHRIVIRTDEDK
jgi:hypothetical protein